MKMVIGMKIKLDLRKQINKYEDLRSYKLKEIENVKFVFKVSV